MTAEVKSRLDLDEMRCTTPDCPCGGVLELRPACHPTRAMLITYKAGVLTVRCSRCESIVQRIAVAEGPAVPDGGSVH